MKKIGIITLHRVVNYGSVLQTYALQKKISELGYDVEVIDYQPRRITMFGMLKGLKNKNKLLKNSFLIRLAVRMILFPSYIGRFITFKKFIKKYIKVTQNKFKFQDDFETAEFKYDIYCTGSDQVWNSEWNECIDKPFYLDFAPECSKKIAYAASFGRENLFDWEIDETKKMLSTYYGISVREKSGINILNDLGIKNKIPFKHVVDPTLLLDENDWNVIASKRFENKEYILVYNLNRNKKIYQYAKNLSKKTGLKVKYISYQIHDFYKYGKMYCNPKVEDFLSLFKNASYVVTDSFHGTAFSLNYNRQFVIIYPQKYSTRVQSILIKTNLIERVAKDENDIDIINNPINYDSVNKILKKEKNESINWLKNVLK